MIDLEPIKARADLFTGYGGAEQDLCARASARDVPELVAEVERLREHAAKADAAVFALAEELAERLRASPQAFRVDL